ncbi:MAG: hypothetical protein H6883_01060 [Rhodobiaceae bacterium]|nr:hypothetical protein [Rhodobiaceae bacterium]MCC0054707.1 hypothetical protein [Rhodobiaceae bacterium]
MTDTTMRADATPVAAAGKLAICIVIAAIVFAAHTVAIINHFEFGGFLLDSGWFAYLFGTVDPLLINPSAINGNSFYSIHFSPVIYLWSLLTTAPFGLTGIQSFALFHGFAYGLPAFLLAWQVESRISAPLLRWFFRLLVVGFFLFGDFVLRETGFPHYEAIVTGFALLTFLSVRANHRLGIVAGFLALAIYREDGGFYAAYATVCATLLQVLEGERVAWVRRGALVMLGVALSVGAVAIQRLYFPGFDAVAGNFSGKHFFSHLSAEFLAGRLPRALLTAGLLPMLITLPILAWQYRGYLVPFVCMLPLLLLHLLSVRDVLGTFALHYGLPFAVLQLVILALAIKRAGAGLAPIGELVALALFFVATSGPVSALLRLENSGYFTLPVLIMTMPTGDTGEKLREIDAILASGEAKVCASVGVVALRPDGFPRGTHLNRSAVPAGCTLAIVYDGDLESTSAKKLLADAGFVETRQSGKLIFFRPGEAR